MLGCFSRTKLGLFLILLDTWKKSWLADTPGFWEKRDDGGAEVVIVRNSEAATASRGGKIVIRQLEGTERPSK